MFYYCHHCNNGWEGGSSFTMTVCCATHLCVNNISGQGITRVDGPGLETPPPFAGMGYSRGQCLVTLPPMSLRGDDVSVYLNVDFYMWPFWIQATK